MTSTVHRCVDAAYWLALSTWTSMLVAAAATAIAAFATLPAMDVSLGEYARFDGRQHGRIAAGAVAGPVFVWGDRVQLGAAAVVTVMLVVQLRRRGRKDSPGRLPGLGRTLVRWADRLRVVCIGMVAAALIGRVLFIMPVMNRTLTEYWEAAAAGQTERAHEQRAAFNRMHHPVSLVFNISLVLMLAAVAASGAALSPVREHEREESR
jgi:hypothetical protein